MRKGFTLIELMIVIAIIAVIAAIAIPGLLAAQRASNERNAGASLKTVTSAQADFRANDRDANRVNDFWTLDLFGLYGLIPIQGGAAAPPADQPNPTNVLKLIEPALAGADGLTDEAQYGNIQFATSLVTGTSKAGYGFRALHNEVTGGVVLTLLNDTDGATFYGAVHDNDRFAFIAFPLSINSGKMMFIVNEDNTLWRYNLPSTYQATFTPATGVNTNSVSTTGGAGLDPFLTLGASGTGTFPAAPPSIGCSKMD